MHFMSLFTQNVRSKTGKGAIEGVFRHTIGIHRTGIPDTAVTHT